MLSRRSPLAALLALLPAAPIGPARAGGGGGGCSYPDIASYTCEGSRYALEPERDASVQVELLLDRLARSTPGRLNGRIEGQSVAAELQCRCGCFVQC